MTAKFTNPLNDIKIASPCSQDWNQMIGTKRKRYCGECKLNVYNLSGMTETEAENLLLNSEGRLCVRFFKRADGTILTKDCPVGWQALKRRASRISTAVVSLFIGLIGGLGLNSFFTVKKQSPLMGAITKVENIEIQRKDFPPQMGEAEIGKVAPDYGIAGGISNLDAVREEVRKNRRR